MIFVGITSVEPDEDQIFDVLTEGLVGLHQAPMLFINQHIEINTQPTRKQLKIFFAWCWQHRFTNVFLTIQKILHSNFSGNVFSQLYTYTPFPKLTIKNLTRTGYQYEDIMMDFKGYEFRVPYFQDPPFVLKLPNGQLSGVMGLLLSAYVTQRGGRLRLEPVVGVDRYNYHEHLMLAAARGEVEIGVHPYSSMQPNSSLTAGSFPLGMTSTCVMVPWQRLPPAEQFMRMAARVNGVFFLFLLLAMTLSWQLARGRWRRGFQLTLTAIFLQSLPTFQFRRLTESYKYIHVAVLLSCFVLWTARTCNLSSVFTSQVPGRQIETAEDFLNSKLQLMLTESEVEMYFTPGLLPEALKPRLLMVNRTMIVKHLVSMNSSYAYCISSEAWVVVMIMQQRMYRPPFRVASKLCTKRQFLHFPVQSNSPFNRNFEKYTLLSGEMGFLNYWRLRSVWEAVDAGIMVQMTDAYQPFRSLAPFDRSFPATQSPHLNGKCRAATAKSNERTNIGSCIDSGFCQDQHPYSAASKLEVLSIPGVTLTTVYILEDVCLGFSCGCSAVVHLCVVPLPH
ncbi:uncharacterized protein LOC108094738 [Drosophila ficusphila]|uniref:uncharacterized protein LOC108094738 n=1 Tax=Drosophila ficusphila TaxID=30025 RepID=UPI0007E5CDDC|nr:uncharacterized protein LOC108094738 [Drosophila ficusphila]